MSCLLIFAISRFHDTASFCNTLRCPFGLQACMSRSFRFDTEETISAQIAFVASFATSWLGPMPTLQVQPEGSRQFKVRTDAGRMSLRPGHVCKRTASRRASAQAKGSCDALACGGLAGDLQICGYPKDPTHLLRLQPALLSPTMPRWAPQHQHSTRCCYNWGRHGLIARSHEHMVWLVFARHHLESALQGEDLESNFAQQSCQHAVSAVAVLLASSWYTCQDPKIASQDLPTSLLRCPLRCLLPGLFNLGRCVRAVETQNSRKPLRSARSEVAQMILEPASTLSRFQDSSCWGTDSGLGLLFG